MSSHTALRTALAVVAVLARVGAAEDRQERLERQFASFDITSRDTAAHKALIAEWDLGQRDVAEFLLARLNQVPSRDEEKLRAANAMACINAASPRKALAWLLDNYDTLTPFGRANMARSLKLLDREESYRVLRWLLRDAAAVKGAEVRGEGPPGPTYDMRVCDYAHNTLCYLLVLEGRLPEGIPGQLVPRTPLPERDKAIAALAAWADGEGRERLRNKPRCGDDALSRKIDKLLAAGERQK